MDIRGWNALIIQRAWARFVRRAFYKSLRERSSFFKHGLSGKRLLFIQVAERCTNSILRAVGSVMQQTLESWIFHNIGCHSMTNRLHQTEGYHCDICELVFKKGDLIYCCSNYRCDWDICRKCKIKWNWQAQPPGPT